MSSTQVQSLPNSPTLGDADGYFRQPALALAQQVRQGDLSAVQLLAACRDRANRLNPQLNALIVDRWERAEFDANAVDEAIARGEDPGPLAGVPFTTKEMASAEGLPVTAGSVARKGAIAQRDSTFVARARAAGAILIGLSNQSELGMWWESSNPVYGRTNNPYDLGRTAGGSSGGEGALVGAGITGFGLGSDMGGSIRLPSLFCGTFGHKPTGNLVPTSGHFPLDYSAYRPDPPPDTRFVCVGPMSRYASDLYPILKLIAGPCDDDPYVVEHDFRPLPEPPSLRVFTLADPKMRFLSAPVPSQQSAVTHSADLLRDAGAQVRAWDGPPLVHALQIFAGVLASIDNGVGLETLLGNGKSVSVAREIFGAARGQRRHSGPTLMLVLGERIGKPRPTGIGRMVRYVEQLAQQIDDVLGDDGVLILPTFPRQAPRHRTTMLRPFDIGYTGLFNVSEHPVTAVPTGMVDGLPTGVQIVGARGRDHVPIAAAVALEQAGLGWVAPS